MAFLNSNSFKVKIQSSPSSPKLGDNSPLASPKKSLLGKDGDEEGANGHGKSQSNGQDLGSRMEHLQLWNKGREVLGASKEYAADIGRSLFHMKERIMYKLAAVPIPAEALDNARHSVETIIKDMTHAAQGMTKDAVQRIKSRLVEIIPSLSATQTEKIVDDVEMEVLDMPQGVAAGDASSEKGDASSEKGNSSLAESNKKEIHREEANPSKSWFITPASSFAINMGRLKRPFSPRSRL